MRVGPPTSYESSVPAQEGGRLDEEPLLSSATEEPPQAAKDCSVRRLQRRAIHLAAQHRNLVAQHDDFDREVGVLAARQPDKLKHADECQVKE